MRGGIYTITCLPTGKIYLGSAKNLDKRWRVHQGLLLHGKHFNLHLQRAWLKYGAKAFSYEIVEVLGAYNKTQYFERENDYIDKFKIDGVALFNIARAQGGWGEDTHSRRGEIGKKISATLTAYAAAMTVEERKTKWGSGRRNKPLSEDHKRKTSLGLIDVPKTEATKINMGIAQKKRAAQDPRVAANMAAIGRKNIGKTPANAIMFTINSTKYPSGTAAMRSLNITSRQLAKMVKEGTAHRERNYQTT